MQRLTSIVAVNEQGAIGAGNSLPWRIRSDLRFFRDQTTNHIVIMGRKTYDSLGKPLPQRENIVVTHGFAFFPQTPQCRAAGGIEEALVTAESFATKKRHAFIVGGASMYEQFAPFVDRYLITEVSKRVPDADTFFNKRLVEPLEDWKVTVVDQGRADGINDEADYKIFELVSRDPQKFAERREAVVQGFYNRRDQNSLSPEFRRRYA